GAQGPAQRADHARRHGALETERIANRYGELAGTNGARITEFGVAEAVGMELKHGEIGIGIIANRIGEEGAAVDQSCFDRGGALDDVTVGEKEPIRREDDAGASA